MAVTPVAPARDRAALIEALGHLSHAAQRCFPKVGNQDLPTPWDLRHQDINDHLTLLELAQ
jgi:hypothetical protein